MSAQYFVIVRDSRDNTYAATLRADTVSDLLGCYDERALHEEARALCSDVIAIKSGERVRYGIVRAHNENEARTCSLARIAWVGDFWYSEQLS